MTEIVLIDHIKTLYMTPLDLQHLKIEELFPNFEFLKKKSNCWMPESPLGTLIFLRKKISHNSY